MDARLGKEKLTLQACPPAHDLASNRYGLRFHHLGLAAANQDVAVSFLTGLGYRIGAPVFDPMQNVHLLMCEHPGMPAVEVISPAQTPGPLDRLLKRHKAGIVYHICYTTHDLAASLQALETDGGLGLRTVSAPKSAVLFDGQEVSFYLVAGIGLIEIIDESTAPQLV